MILSITQKRGAPHWLEVGSVSFIRRKPLAAYSILEKKFDLEEIFSFFEWETCTVTTGSGKIISGLEFPVFWSDNARIQVAEKYFRRADVPLFPQGIYDIHMAEKIGLNWKDLPTGGEKSLKHVVNRMCGAITHWGNEYGYFNDIHQSDEFRKKFMIMMINQEAALNSPQWFNTGIHWAYGIDSNPKGQYYYDFKLNKAVESVNGFEHPQAHACFILGVKDDLFGPNGIFDTARREAQIFYFGSGAGSNYATLRGKGEPVSGGGVSSGMMSFLDIYDAGGGAIKSGGKTRRAAKMDICSDSHPEIREFVEWKMRQEKMVRLLIESGMSGGFEDEAYRTVRGMNSNNTVAFTHKFFDALKNDKDWELRWVTDPSHVSDRFPARELWEKVVYCTWFSADPGIHATDTINEWNTCIGDERIVSSNPCSEYLWFNETACNLASINLVKFYDSENNVFDVESFCKAVDVWQTALDITVSMAQYPASDICEKSMQYRTTGLGYTNLGGLLMLMGYGYASAEGQQVAGAITAILGGRSYVQSSILASNLSAYPAYERNAEHHLRVIRNHRRAAYGLNTEYEGVTKAPRGIDPETFPAVHSYLLESARKQWDNALTLGKMHGFRNAQTTVLAPTGTISFAMDADTFGIEPDYALIKYKALAGGGYAVITNRLVDPALKNIGYADKEREAILKHIEKTGSVEGAPYLRMDHYNVFDTAVAAAGSTRSLSASSHIEMMAACQPFLSGAISKTVNLPESATEKDISDAYLYGYELGLKAIAVFRANSKAASVMFTRAEDMAKRETIDLGSKHFDVEKIFHRQFVYEMPQEIEMHVANSYGEEINTELAVEMPAYGCKDGVCSI